jgi:ATP-binding cassette, subfamily B, bacterial
MSAVLEAELDVADLAEIRGTAWATVRRGWAMSPQLRRGARGTVALAFGGAAGRMVTPVLLQQVIDRAIRDDHVRFGVVVPLAMAGTIVLTVAALCQRWAVVRLGTASEAALCELRCRAFEHIQALSVAEHADQRRGALVARVTSDVDRLSQFFAWGALAWLVNAVLVAAVVTVMAAYDWRLTIVAVVTAAPVVVLLRAAQRHLERAYDSERVTVGEYLAQVSESVSGAAAVRAYGLGDVVGVRLHGAIERRRRAANRASLVGAFLFPVGEVFSALTIATVVGVGLALGPGSGLTAGALVAFVFLTKRFLEPIAEFTEVMDQTQTAVAGLRRVLNVLDTTIDVEQAADAVVLGPGPHRVELHDVVFRYRPRRGQSSNNKRALDNVTLRIEPGRNVAVVGATGSGKSTLAKLLVRLADPSEGRVSIGGVDLRDLQADALRAAVVLVPQEPFLFNTSVAANVAFMRTDPDSGASRRDVAAVFDRLGLTDWAESLPAGLGTVVGERGELLSAGERQLVALARAQFVKPGILVLDEATSSVDAASEARLARAVAALTMGRTTVTIAHRLSTAMRADRVVVMHGGRVIEDGTHTELVALGGRYAELFAHWLRATDVDQFNGEPR